MHAAVLAKSGEAVKAGPIGLAVILLLCIACYFLFKSMSKHMRTVRENFPTGEAPSPNPVPSDVQRAELVKTEPAERVTTERAEPDGPQQPE